MSQHRQRGYAKEIYCKDRYRIPSTRLHGWDYTRDGFYFVTICVQDRLSCLAEIVGDEIHLSPMGVIIADEWEKTAEIRKNVELDEWVIMPDHVHGIIGIVHSDDIKMETPRRKIVETPCRGLSTMPTAAACAAWKPNSLGSIIGQFQSKTTKRIRAAGDCDFAWQARFYDHIIRDNADRERIRRYIQENPASREEE